MPIFFSWSPLTGPPMRKCVYLQTTQGTVPVQRVVWIWGSFNSRFAICPAKIPSLSPGQEMGNSVHDVRRYIVE